MGLPSSRLAESQNSGVTDARARVGNSCAANALATARGEWVDCLGR